MIVLVTVLVLVAAMIAGLLVNRAVWRPRQEAGSLSSDGLQMKEVTGPLASLAVLLLAFVLVQSFTSYSSARRAEAAESTAMLLLFREAELLQSPRARDGVQRDVVCYATSVIRQDWPAMQREQVSNVPNHWASEIRRTAVRGVRSGNDADAGKAILAREGQRATGRQDRLAEARSAVPDDVLLLMLLAVAVAVVLIGIVTSKGISPSVHRIVVVVATFVFGATLLLIHDLDQPYGGLTGRDAAQTAFIRTQMLDEIGAQALPCDARGLPRDAPLFRPQVRPLD